MGRSHSLPQGSYKICLLADGCPCGSSGTGKTALMRTKLQNMDTETMCFNTINLNSFSDAPSVQTILEQPLEKKSGRISNALLKWMHKPCRGTQ